MATPVKLIRGRDPAASGEARSRTPEAAARSPEAGAPADRRGRSRAIVGIVEAYDVVLAEVAAGLHLDQLQIDLARICQAVEAADRQIDRLVLMDDVDLLVARHL